MAKHDQADEQREPGSAAERSDAPAELAEVLVRVARNSAPISVLAQVLATAQRFAHLAQPVRVTGEAGALFGPRDKPIAVIGFTITGGRVAALNLIAGTDKLRQLTIQP